MAGGFLREGADREPVPLEQLTTRQRQVLEVVDCYHEAVAEPCPAALVARRLRIDPQTAREHLRALHRKGWLRAPNSPAVLTQRPLGNTLRN